MDSIISRLKELKIDNLTSTLPESATPSLAGLQDVMEKLTLKDLAPNSSPSLPNEAGQASVDFKRLWLLDERLESHMKLVLLQLDQLASPDQSALGRLLTTLSEEKRWLAGCVVQLEGLQEHDDEGTRIYGEFMRDRVSEFKAAVDMYVEVLQDRSAASSSPENIQTDRYFKTNLNGRHSPSLVTILNVVAQNLFGHATRDWCNANLQSHKLFMEEIFTEGGRAMSEREASLHSKLPTDIRTARHNLDIEADVTTYASCPKCRCTYPPSKNGAVLVWPSECTWRPFPSSQPCSQTLVKSGVLEGQSVRVPIQPFTVQDFDSFVGRMLSRPGYEAMLDQGTVLNPRQDYLEDIKDGAAIRGLNGPDKKPFIDGLKRGELRLVWSLSVDWFNPYHNKQAGKKASCGSIAMMLLNLPPSLRHRQENIYLHGLMPVEPSLNEINFFLSPLIDKLQRNYEHGVHFSKTYQSPLQGRSSRSAVAVFIFDLPGAKKVTGHTSYNSSLNFCSFCHLSKSEISNFDWQHWQPRRCGDLRAAAIAWRDAPNNAERKLIFQEHGVRWSVLWSLSYYDPTRSVVVDGMHNLFEGLVQYHLREILGIDRPDAAEAVAEPKKLEAGRALLGTNPSRRSLERLNVAILKTLCLEKGLRPPVAQKGKRVKKSEYVDILEDFAKEVSQPSNHAAVAYSKNITTDFISDIVGQEYMQELEPPKHQWRVGDDAINKKELQCLHGYLGQTVRPSWHTPPPANLGEASHGKLKADQERSAIEFDVPAAIAQIWQRDSQAVASEQMERKKKLVDATFLLATAIRWATSYITSTTHACQYMICMSAYLNALKELYPSMAWRPNHHAALHIGQFLLLFGPMHGWWMFPFERLIGRLQKANTNYKPGELEQTMLKTFCASANFWSLILQHTKIPAVLKFRTIIERVREDRSRDPLAGIMASEEDNKLLISLAPAKRQRSPPTLSPRALCTLASYYQLSFQRLLPISSITSFSSHSINGISFSAHTESERNSTVFFRATNQQMCPATIQFIVSVPDDSQDDIFLIVERYAPLNEAVANDPFASHQAFGASLWCSKRLTELEVISSHQVVCHGIRRPWVHGITLLKPLDRAYAAIASPEATTAR